MTTLPFARNDHDLRVVYLNEVVNRIEWKGTTFILHATGDAHFNEQTSQLVIQLGCVLEPEKGPEEEVPAILRLPCPQTEKETVAREEAVEVAKEIFHAWVRRVRDELEETAAATQAFTVSHSA
jgi:hypothetical protein